MLRAVPLVEVTHDANAFGIRRPHGKRDPGQAFVRHHMRAELFIDAFVFAFAEEMQVEFAERGREVLRRLWSGSTDCAFSGRPGVLLCAFAPLREASAA